MQEIEFDEEDIDGVPLDGAALPSVSSAPPPAPIAAGVGASSSLSSSSSSSSAAAPSFPTTSRLALQRLAAEEKRKRQEEEAAAVYAQFVASFEGGTGHDGRRVAAPTQSQPLRFVSGGLIAGNTGDSQQPQPQQQRPPVTPAEPPAKRSRVEAEPGRAFATAAVSHASFHQPPPPPPPPTLSSPATIPPAALPGPPAGAAGGSGKRRNIDLFLEELKQQTTSGASSATSSTTSTSSTWGIRELSTHLLPSLDAPLTTNLYLSNLPLEVKGEELVDRFLRFGDIASYRVLWPRGDEVRRVQHRPTRHLALPDTQQPHPYILTAPSLTSFPRCPPPPPSRPLSTAHRSACEAA